MSSTALTLKDFYALDGSGYTQRDAEVIGPVIADLQGGDGIVPPRALLDSARSQASPIHHYFEWDNATAAEAYRLGQAKDMLRSVRVQVIERRPQDGIPARRSSLPQLPAHRPSTMNVISRATSHSAEMADKAYQEIAQWKRRYESYSAAWKKFADVFAGVVNQISECEDAVNLEGIEFKTNAAMRELLLWRDRHGPAAAVWLGWDDQRGYLAEAIEAADDALCKVSEEDMPKAKCIQCGKEFTPKHERHRLCESC